MAGGPRKHGAFSYDSRRWRRLSVLHRQKFPYCEACQPVGRLALAEHVDHKIPISKGGDPWSESNMQSLCAPCHSAKTRGDETGRRWGPKGCDADGWPVDPAHHWRR